MALLSERKDFFGGCVYCTIEARTVISIEVFYLSHTFYTLYSCTNNYTCTISQEPEVRPKEVERIRRPRGRPPGRNRGRRAANRVDDENERMLTFILVY